MNTVISNKQRQPLSDIQSGGTESNSKGNSEVVLSDEEMTVESFLEMQVDQIIKVTLLYIYSHKSLTNIDCYLYFYWIRNFIFTVKA